MFIPSTIPERTECLNWLFWLQGAAPLIGGAFGHFYNYAPIHIEYAIDRASLEMKRLHSVLDQHLEGKKWVCGDDITIADFAIAPWFMVFEKGYTGADKFLKVHEYKNVQRYLKEFKGREAVRRGIRVNGFGKDRLDERHSPEDFASHKM